MGPWWIGYIPFRGPSIRIRRLGVDRDERAVGVGGVARACGGTVTGELPELGQKPGQENLVLFGYRSRFSQPLLYWLDKTEKGWKNDEKYGIWDRKRFMEFPDHFLGIPFSVGKIPNAKMGYVFGMAPTPAAKSTASPLLVSATILSPMLLLGGGRGERERGACSVTPRFVRAHTRHRAKKQNGAQLRALRRMMAAAGKHAGSISLPYCSNPILAQQKEREWDISEDGDTSWVAREPWIWERIRMLDHFTKRTFRYVVFMRLFFNILHTNG
jgi:hypothetical protein